MRSVFSIFILLFSFQVTFAQNFGGNPASVKWKQINTDTVRIIFPQGLDTIANRIANTAHYLQKNYSSTIGGKIRKINIVLQDNTTVSNAYVALAPFRSEFYLMPAQNAFDLDAQYLPHILSVHEFRHVQQYVNFNAGLSKAMSVLFGENGEALANAASIPDWFFEGDAVYNETMLSRQGRGRLPLFFSSYKSLYNAGKSYTYMQLRNGSYKNYIPDHYRLGYLLVAYGREKYGDDFWLKVTHDAAAFKPLFYPLQGSVKKYTGILFREFADNAFKFYHQQWNEDKNSPVTFITKTEKNNVVNYKYPYRIEDGSLIVLKATYKDIPSFYFLHPDGTEEKIAVKDIAYDDYYSYNNGKIVYAAYQPDIRWSNKDFSVIKMLNVKTGEEKNISRGTRYFSPDISHDGKLIAAVQMHSDLSSDIVLLDENGNIKNTISNKQSIIYSYPKFSADDDFLYVMIRNNNGEMGIQKISLSDYAITDILPLRNRIVGFPAVIGDTLLYSCSNNGKDEIWAYTAMQKSHYRLAMYGAGLYQAMVTDDGNIISSAFTADGYRLAKTNPLWQHVSKNDTLTNLYVTHPFNSDDNNLMQKIPLKDYPVTRYPKAFNLFNFHSWSPYLQQPDYSFIVYGENVLNTFQSQLYYTYNSNEKYSRAGCTGIYGGWFLQPVFDINQTWHRNTPVNADTIAYWNELNASFGLNLPLDFSGGKSFRNLSLSTTYHFNNLHWTGLAKEFLQNVNFNYLQANLTYTSQVQKAVQHIFPHWGQTFSFQYRSIINKYTSRQFLAVASFYLPGFAKTHNIVLNAAYQERDTSGEYFFTNNFPFSRGYDAFDFPRMLKLGGNYYFPIAYPDWGFGNIVFFKRIRADLFYDYTVAKSLRTGDQYHFKTAGIELYFDTRWWNQQPLSLGIRYTHLLDNELAGLAPNQWEIILPVTLS